MTHYLEYRLGPTDDGKEVLFLMQKVLGFTTKKVRSVKHEEWGILLNGKRVRVRARGKEGQLLKVMLEDSQEKQNKIASTKMNLHILYEDEDLIFVDKPAGIVSHPSKGHLSDSMINGVQAVKGNPPEEGILEIPMEEMRDARDGDKLKMKVGKSENAKTAKTFFQVVKRFEKFSLVSLVIETGRTHQIRFHMASIGCPLLGDSFYGDGPELGISRTALHAQQLTFTHPFCEKVMRIESEMPKDLSFLLR